MVKLFKIIEKTVGALVAIAVIMIFALIAIGVVDDSDSTWSNVRPYTLLLYGVAIIVVTFKAAILGVQMYLESKIEEKTEHLQAIMEKQRGQQIIQEKKVSDKLDKIINDIAAIPNTDTTAIIDFLKTNLPNVVSTMVEQQVCQQVAYEKQRLALEYENRERIKTQITYC